MRKEQSGGSRVLILVADSLCLRDGDVKESLQILMHICLFPVYQPGEQPRSFREELDSAVIRVASLQMLPSQLASEPREEHLIVDVPWILEVAEYIENACDLMRPTPPIVGRDSTSNPPPCVGRPV